MTTTALPVLTAREVMTSLDNLTLTPDYSVTSNPEVVGVNESGSVVSDDDFLDLEYFRYYTEGVSLTPISIFGIIGKEMRLLFAA